MIRRLFVLALTVTVWGGSLALLGLSFQTRAEALRGVEDPLTAEALPYRLPRFGVNVELNAYDDRELAQQLERIEQAGITWVRQYVYWNQVEPVSGEFTWDALDRLMAAVAERPELRLILVIQNSPAWAIDPEATDPTGPPRDPADLARFAAALAERYGAQVDYYQIWDEPNLFTNWGGMPPKAVRYAAMLEAAHTAIHAADPSATVLSAGLAPTIELGPDNISDWVYLRDLYTLGASAYFDGVGAKPYGFNSSPDDRRVEHGLLNFSRVIGLREIMVEFGDSHKAVWASHWGWNSLPADWAGRPSIWGAVTAEQQVDYTLRALERAEHEWPWMAGMTLHHWNPPYPADHPQQGFALTESISGELSVFGVRLSAALPDENIAAGIGWHPAKTPHARYSGVWTFTDYGADIGWLRDSRLSFDFDGQSVGLILRQDNYVANLYPLVDGQPAEALPRDAADNTYLTLTSASLKPTVGAVPVATRLTSGAHKLEVVADQGFDRYALVGYAVGAGDLAAPHNAQTAVALVTVIVSFAALALVVSGLPWGVWNQRFGRWLTGLSWTVQLAIGGITSLALLFGLLMTWGQELPSVFRREPVLPAIALLSSGLAYLNIAMPVTLAALAILFWCIYHRILIGLALTLLFAPFFLFPVKLYLFAFPLAEIVLLLTAAAWVARALADWGRMRRVGQPLGWSWSAFHPADGLVLAYVLLGAAAWSWSALRGEAATEYRTLFLEPALFYLIFRTARLSLGDLRRLMVVFIMSGVCVAGISLLQYVRGEAIIVAEDASRRLAGVYGSPNNLALLLGRIIPFVFAALVVSSQRRTRWLSALALGVMGVAALLTQSVGGVFIGIPAALAVVLVVAQGRRGVIGLMIVAVLVVVGFSVAASQSDRFARALDFTQGTNFYRVRVMQSAWQMIEDHPLTGLGLDQFLYAFRDRYIYPDAWPEPNLSHPHNILLDFWVRLGILGVPLLLSFIGVLVWGLNAAYRQWRAHPFWGWVVLGIIGAMVDTLVHGLLDNSIFVIDLALIFFALLAFTVALQRGKLPVDSTTAS
ncbi:MAG: O-antigen ligase family protein [Anaerolineae bacterium]|nr:O-antigen ligase family protein [Anaerolineae bacterium]